VPNLTKGLVGLVALGAAVADDLADVDVGRTRVYHSQALNLRALDRFELDPHLSDSWPHGFAVIRAATDRVTPSVV